MASLAPMDSFEAEPSVSSKTVLLTPEKRDTLYRIVRERSFRQGTFTLSSGEQSNLYFNMKPTMMCAEGAALTALAFLDLARAAKAEYVSGLEMGAVPAIGAMAAVSQLKGLAIATTFVRKRKKGHGTQDLVEGLGPDQSLVGKRVLVIDDVATSGGSILQAIEAVREAGGLVDTAAALVNRHEGGDELLQERGVTLTQVFSAQEFID